MPKRPEIGPTDGKVTYIHGAAPRAPYPEWPPFPPVTTPDELKAAMRERVTIIEYDAERWREIDAANARRMAEQLDAAEFEVSENGGYIFPPEGLRVRPDAPSVQVYFGLDVSSEPDYTASWEADERNIWDPDQSRAEPPPPPVDLLSLTLLIVIVGMMTILGVAIINLFPSTVFAEFLQTLHLPR